MISEKELEILDREFYSDVNVSYLACKVPALIKEIRLLRKVAEAAKSYHLSREIIEDRKEVCWDTFEAFSESLKAWEDS